MKRFLFGFLAVALATNLSVAAEPKAVIEKAIEAHGGRKLLEKYPAAKVSFTGEMTVMGQNATMSGTNTTDKGKIKVEIEMSIAGQKVKIVQMASGDKTQVRLSVGGMNVDAPVTEGQKEELKLSSHYAEITTLVPLFDETKFELKSEADEEVEKKKADVVSVKLKAHDRTLKLYFDKESKLLVMVAREGIVPGSQDDKKGKLATLLGDYKKQDGVMVPMKITSKVDGEVFLTATVTEHVNLEKTDAKEFAIDD
jgi:hypothetical protein